MSADSKLKTKLVSYLSLGLLRFLGVLAQILPKSLVLPFFSNLAYLFSPLLTRELGIAEAQISLAQRKRPNFKAPENLSKKVFRHIGECFGEALILNKILPLNLIPKDLLDSPAEISGFSFTGFEHIREILKNDNSAVALSAHIGPIEILAAYLVQCGIPLYAIGKKPNYPALATFLDEFRRSYGTGVIWREDQRSVRTILKAIKDGGVIGALIDQDTSLENEFVESFGVDAAFPIGIIKLAVQYKLPILTAFIVRKRRLNYSVISHKIDYDPESPTVIEDILNQYSQQLDELIMQYPDQWVWWHRRWRRRPGVDYRQEPQQLRSTKDYVHWIKNIA